MRIFSAGDIIHNQPRTSQSTRRVGGGKQPKNNLHTKWERDDRQWPRNNFYLKNANSSLATISGSKTADDDNDDEDSNKKTSSDFQTLIWTRRHCSMDFCVLFAPLLAKK